MPVTRIDLLRHGEPEGGSRYRGSSIDDPLTDRGWQQMAEGVGCGERWDVVVSSPLVRCSAFAKRLAAEQEIPLEINAEFREIGFGAWEGKTKPELRRERLAEFNAFYADPVANTPEDAEPVLEFFARIAQAYDTLKTLHAGKRVLVVAHAGVIRAVATHVLGAEPSSMYRIEVKNGCVTRCRHTASSHILEGLNLVL